MLDETAFDALVERHRRELQVHCYRLLGSFDDSEDLVQETFLRAWRNRASFAGRATSRTWLYRITINHCKNLLQTWHQRHLVNNNEDSLWENAVAGTESPLRVLEIKELGQRIQKTLDLLPEEYRLLLLLVADQQLSYDEIATLTEQSADAVRGKLHRARKAFIAQFQKFA